METYHGTTILSVRCGSLVALGGDGQVTLGNIVVKASASKVRKLYREQVLAGFAGATADAFTLFERFEAKLEKHQGSLPIRVELGSLSVEDFEAILTSTQASLVSQYSALLATEGVNLQIGADAVRRLAQIAFDVNERTKNIGACRLATVMERLLDEVSFDAP